jgi:hypothetical protein
LMPTNAALVQWWATCLSWTSKLVGFSGPASITSNRRTTPAPGDSVQLHWQIFPPACRSTECGFGVRANSLSRLLIIFISLLPTGGWVIHLFLCV